MNPSEAVRINPIKAQMRTRHGRVMGKIVVITVSDTNHLVKIIEEERKKWEGRIYVIPS